MAAPTRGEQVYATLLLTDSYLPGALVLAHSLRDAGTSKKLAVLVTPDTVSEETVTQLRTVYDYVLPVPTIRNDRTANLHLMDRADLHSAFTKINLWKLTQFSRIVYIDADVVAYRAVDELFDIPHAFAAAPDIGWPDIFNSGVMVLTPNMGDYYALLAMADRGISFDGADQGLLNMYFKNNFHRLSFTYNVTPSAHYQCLPAYRHFQSSINLVHFIGTNKPWKAGRDAKYNGSGYDEMVGRWWAVHDRYYRVPDGTPQTYKPSQSDSHSHDSSWEHVYNNQTWDASRHPPPTNTRPEGQNFPRAHYHMSRDTRPYVNPKRYIAAPEYQTLQSSSPPQAVFPWEGKQPAPARVFEPEPEEQQIQQAPVEQVVVREIEPVARLETFSQPPASVEYEDISPVQAAQGSPWSSYSRSNAWDEVPGINRYVEGFEKRRRRSVKSVKGAPGSPTQKSPTQDSPQPGFSGQKVQPPRTLKLTDFPSEVERPSLPVTPAPVRRESYWALEDAQAEGGRLPLPAAAGVPAQAEWDPNVQLQKLAQQQSEALLRKLGGREDAGEFSGGDIPTRPLPFGSEPIKSPSPSAHPTVLSPRPVKGAAALTTSALERKMRANFEESGDESDAAPRAKLPIQPPEYSGPGAAFDKDDMELHQQTPLLPSEEERDVLQT